jgi:hypothetical protein
MTEITNSDDKRKHLEMIQGVINRMSSNSFLFKGWSITLIAAISAFAAKDTNSVLMIIPVVSTLLFWAVDAYYLMLERAFRKVYDEVAQKSPSQIDYKMNLADKDIGLVDWIRTLRRPILMLFYGIVLIMLLLLICVLNKFSVEVLFHHGA